MLSARRLVQVYEGHFRVTMARYMTYRLELVLWLTSMILAPVIFMVVWQTASRDTGGSIEGFSTADIATYFIIVMMVNHLTLAWSMWEWEARVRLGALSYHLLRPHHPLHRDLAENFAFKVATFPVMAATAVGLGFAFRPHLAPEIWQVAAFAASLALAYALRFTVDWTVALAALFLTQVTAVNVLYFFALLLTSGQMAPLPVMPEHLRTLANFLPFRWMLDFPAELLMGRLSPQQALSGLGIQALWLAAMIGLRRWLWDSGMRRYTAVGL